MEILDDRVEMMETVSRRLLGTVRVRVGVKREEWVSKGLSLDRLGLDMMKYVST